MSTKQDYESQMSYARTNLARALRDYPKTVSTSKGTERAFYIGLMTGKLGMAMACGVIDCFQYEILRKFQDVADAK